MRELREDAFSQNKNEDAHNHIDRVVNIVSLFNILRVSQDAILLRVFPFALTGSAKRWVDRLTPGAVNTWDLLKKAFIQKYCPPSKTAEQLEDIHNFKMTSTQALTAIQTMADHSQKLHDRTSSRNISSSSDTDGLVTVIRIGKLEPIDMVIEMADNTKFIPKGIVKNLLVKIDKFILPVDFVILNMIEDLRMPVVLGRPLLATDHTKVDIFRKTISLEVGNEKVIFKMRSNLSDNIHESVRMIKPKMNTKEDKLMKIDSDLFTYNTNACETNHLLSIDPDVFTYDIEVQESYEEIIYRCSLITQEANGGFKSNLTAIKKKLHWCTLISSTKERVQEIWASCSPFKEKCDGGLERLVRQLGIKFLEIIGKKRFRNKYDDSEDFKDLGGCKENKENEILKTIINKLHDECFKGTHEDDDDLEGIIDYLEPTLYDGFIDSDDEEYKERKCRLLGMPYIKPPLILIEKVTAARRELLRPTLRDRTDISQKDEKPNKKRQNRTRDGKVCEDEAQSKSRADYVNLGNFIYKRKKGKKENEKKKDVEGLFFQHPVLLPYFYPATLHQPLDKTFPLTPHGHNAKLAIQGHFRSKG
ncbi:RNA-directed DNA polymerase, eukaryota, reverse transcriptase zinc-binding domain protein [Tanacetum coccineum]